MRGEVAVTSLPEQECLGEDIIRRIVKEWRRRLAIQLNDGCVDALVYDIASRITVKKEKLPFNVNLKCENCVHCKTEHEFCGENCRSYENFKLIPTPPLPKLPEKIKLANCDDAWYSDHEPILYAVNAIIAYLKAQKEG